MKSGIILGLLGILGLITFGIAKTHQRYTFEKDYTQYWNLADKSSTIQAKQQYVTKFVEALETNKKRFAAHDAIFMKTPDNSFEQNLIALKTLSQRLEEIQDMNPSSFEYNTAIQQITQQEQGEAHKMLSVFWRMLCVGKLLSDLGLDWRYFRGIGTIAVGGWMLRNFSRYLKIN